MKTFVINFKTYKESSGKNALELAKKIESVDKNIIVVPQATDIRMIAEKIKNPVFAQHIDTAIAGSCTGHITAGAVKDAGASGTLINHSERPLDLERIEKTVKIASEMGLETVVCVPSVDMLKKVVPIRPDFIAIEPPELIGSGIAVSRAQPYIIESALKEKRDIPLLCGAGITNGEDVRRAIELGVDGILVASAIVKSKNAVNVVEDMKRFMG